MVTVADLEKYEELANSINAYKSSVVENVLVYCLLVMIALIIR